MKVYELIAFLLTQPQDAIVTYSCCSESCVLEANEIYLDSACAPRNDGWVQNARPDMPQQQYLRFPGN